MAALEAVARWGWQLVDPRYDEQQPQSHRIRTPYAGVLAAAVAMDIGGIVPVALIGALELQLREAMDVSVAFVGLATALFFVTGGLVAVAFGPEIDRLGARRTATLAVALSVTALLLLAGASEPWEILAALALAGTAQAAVVPATNILLAEHAPPDRIARAISIKLASMPAGLLLAGVAIPAIALTIGWRWAFVVAALIPLTGRLAAPPSPPGTVAARRPPRSEARAAQRRLARFGLGVFLASLLPGALTGYGVATLVDANLDVGTAGLLFAVGNAIGITTRVCAGLAAEATGSDGYRPIAALMIAGGVGAFLLAGQGQALTIAGALVALGVGVGWPGLGFFLVVRAEARNPGASGAVIQMGGMLGSATGPALVGAIAARASLSAAWLLIGAAVTLGGLVVESARRRGRALSVGPRMRTAGDA